jgi:UrcA family protein
MTMSTANTSARKHIGICYFVTATMATAWLAVTSTAVHAADPSGPMSITVRYGDLNLANPYGIERLYRRIVGAAQQVCRNLDGISLEEKAEFSICTKESIARAVAAVDQPALTSLYTVKTGQVDRPTKLAKQ